MTAIAIAPEFGACQFKQLTVSNSSVTLESLWVAASGTAFATLAAKTLRLNAWIHAEGVVRFDPAGGTPTTTAGLRLLGGTDYILQNQFRMLTTMKVIREGGADVKLNVAIFS